MRWHQFFADDEDGEKKFVYLLLQTIVKNFNFINSRQVGLPELSDFFESFSNSNFLRDANQLSQKLISTISHSKAGEQTEIQSTTIFRNLKSLVDYFYEIPSFDTESHKKSDFLLVCFITEFFEAYYPHIMGQFKSDPYYDDLLKEKLEFRCIFFRSYQDFLQTGSNFYTGISEAINSDNIEALKKIKMKKWISKFTFKLIHLPTYQMEEMYTDEVPKYTNLWFQDRNSAQTQMLRLGH
jgi:hypothetical protein